MKYSCPYCNGSGKLGKYPSDKVAEDGEALVAKCESCKNEFSVSVTISPAPISVPRISRNINLAELEQQKNNALAKLMQGKVYRVDTGRRDENGN
jgi:hypothetical protein